MKRSVKIITEERKAKDIALKLLWKKEREIMAELDTLRSAIKILERK